MSMDLRHGAEVERPLRRERASRDLPGIGRIDDVAGLAGSLAARISRLPPEASSTGSRSSTCRLRLGGQLGSVRSWIGCRDTMATRSMTRSSTRSAARRPPRDRLGATPPGADPPTPGRAARPPVRPPCPDRGHRRARGAVPRSSARASLGRSAAAAGYGGPAPCASASRERSSPWMPMARPSKRMAPPPGLDPVLPDIAPGDHVWIEAGTIVERLDPTEAESIEAILSAARVNPE